MSTVYGLNNRRYHGLYVLPTGVTKEKIIILSKFEESIFIDNQVYELSTNQFSGGIHPEGYKYLQQFSVDPFPKFQFEIEGKRIEKTIFMLHDQHVLVLRYAYKNQGPSLNLVLKPMIAGRNINDLSHEISTINSDSYLESGVVKLAPMDTIPELKIYYQNGEYIPAPLWYHSYVYEKDYRRRRSSDREMAEDLFNPGFFTCSLEPYDTLDLYVSIDDLNYFDYEAIYREEKEYRQSFDKTFVHLTPVAKDISKRIEILRKKSDKTALPHVHNIPFDEHHMREILFMQFGLFLFTEHGKEAENILSQLFSYLHNGLLPDIIDEDGTVDNYQSADLGLILLHLVYYLYNFRIDSKYIEEKIFDSCREIIDHFIKGSNADIFMDKDGLISAGNRSVSASLFSIKNSNGIYKRYGKMVDINALWYNALRIMEYFSREFGKKRLIKKYATLAEQTKKSFLKTFWNTRHLCFYDYINDNDSAPTLSLSQLYLITLPFSMLDAEKGLFILKQIEEHLLAPLGLRSLSPNEKSYKGRLDSIVRNKDAAYFLGGIWPWAVGMYVDAVLKFRGSSQKVLESLNIYLDTLGEFFYEQGLGNISEFFEGNPPYRRNGQMCYGLNLTELLRAFYTLHQVKSQN